ncbi:hypothetical protein Cmtc_49670 [Cupriavidus sp. TKC]|uniref:hypothetical protein n=1 Tax=Cupriavidus TaxID=106589 RepID=UPI0002A42301|nr:MULTISPECIES: hypothetical protein [Cupriavidus]ELA00052.1 hypothetical protein D769_07043 [Cupriavidus sp. HMR-1]GMG93747.1 hypothetical protein Cmtc_49670 [Cupriavidus sp. TKC]
MQPRKWHTNLLILFLAGWSLVSLIGVSVLMIRAPMPVDPADCLLFLWTPILIGWASWLLFRQHRYQALPLCIVPAMYIMTAVRLSQGRLSFVNWRVNLWNLTSFPLGYGLCAAFFLACAFYAARLEARASA